MSFQWHDEPPKPKRAKKQTGGKKKKPKNEPAAAAAAAAEPEAIEIEDDDAPDPDAAVPWAPEHSTETCKKQNPPGDEERRRLDKDEYLNDVIVNAMMCIHTVGTHYYPMSSFWYNKFAVGKNTDRYFSLKKRFVPAGVRNISEMEGVVIPINENTNGDITARGNHWTLIIVEFATTSITYYNSLMMASAYREKAVDNVFKYLERESEGLPEHGKTPFYFDREDWVDNVVYEDTPEQPDGFNCGVFVSMRARKHLKGIDFPDTPELGRAQIKAALGL